MTTDQIRQQLLAWRKKREALDADQERLEKEFAVIARAGRKAGLSLREIGELASVSRNTVYAYLRKNAA